MITASTSIHPKTVVPTPHYMKNAKASAKFAKAQSVPARQAAKAILTAELAIADVHQNIQKPVTPLKDWSA